MGSRWCRKASGWASRPSPRAGATPRHSLKRCVPLSPCPNVSLPIMLRNHAARADVMTVSRPYLQQGIAVHEGVEVTDAAAVNTLIAELGPSKFDCTYVCPPVPPSSFAFDQPLALTPPPMMFGQPPNPAPGCHAPAPVVLLFRANRQTSCTTPASPTGSLT